MKEKKRKIDRWKDRWEDNIKEWTGMNFASLTRAAESRTRRKGIVANCCFFGLIRDPDNI